MEKLLKYRIELQGNIRNFQNDLTALELDIKTRLLEDYAPECLQVNYQKLYQMYNLENQD